MDYLPGNRISRERRVVALMAWGCLVSTAVILWNGRQTGTLRSASNELTAILLAAFGALVSIFAWMLFNPERRTSTDSPGLFLAAAATLFPPPIVGFCLMPTDSPLRGWLAVGLFLLCAVAVLSHVPDELFAVPRGLQSYLSPLPVFDRVEDTVMNPNADWFRFTDLTDLVTDAERPSLAPRAYLQQDLSKNKVTRTELRTRTAVDDILGTDFDLNLLSDSLNDVMEDRDASKPAGRETAGRREQAGSFLSNVTRQSPTAETQRVSEVDRRRSFGRSDVESPLTQTPRREARLDGSPRIERSHGDAIIPETVRFPAGQSATPSGLPITPVRSETTFDHGLPRRSTAGEPPSTNQREGRLRESLPESSAADVFADWSGLHSVSHAEPPARTDETAPQHQIAEPAPRQSAVSPPQPTRESSVRTSRYDQSGHLRHGESVSAESVQPSQPSRPSQSSHSLVGERAKPVVAQSSVSAAGVTAAALAATSLKTSVAPGPTESAADAVRSVIQPPQKLSVVQRTAVEPLTQPPTPSMRVANRVAENAPAPLKSPSSGVTPAGSREPVLPNPSTTATPEPLKAVAAPHIHSDAKSTVSSAPGAAGTPQVTRIQESDGSELVEGVMPVRFDRGQRRANVHIPFSPPLGGIPEVECECVGDAVLRLKVPVRQSYGVRIEARRTDADEPLETEIGFAAVYTPDSE
ncbi:MAG: hypothetical protein KDA89_12100 [Planctomycetaceae bacterium]|nr:hypothetical protein [Planctomycetaceae bacterium]